MEDSVLDKPIVLKLNRLWQRIGWSTPRQAFVAMVGGEWGGTPPFQGLSITTDENGELVEGIALGWEEWVKLPIRPCDFAISTGRGSIRVPSVIVAPVFSGMPKNKVRLTGKSLRDRDGGICQVSGRKLAPGEGNMGHLKARALGGHRTWENLVYMDKKLNSIQGTKTIEEMGWKLSKEPRAPNPVPSCAFPAEAKSPDHGPFIK
jgi:hypothetical protein